MVKDKEKNDNFCLFYALSTAIQLGFFIVVPIGLSLFLGIWLDSYFKTEPILLLLTTFSGIIFTIYEVHNILKPILNDKNKPC